MNAINGILNMDTGDVEFLDPNAEHGKVWELVKYEWRDGRGRFLYVRRADDVQQEIWRDQPRYQVKGVE